MQTDEVVQTIGSTPIMTIEPESEQAYRGAGALALIVSGPDMPMVRLVFCL